MTRTHGKATAYEKDGCRCEACTDRHNERVAKNRADRLASGRLNHGSRSAYDAGCRCDACKGARRAAAGRERDAARRGRKVAADV